MARITTAIQYPKRAQRQSPKAAIAHAIETAHIRTRAQDHMDVKPSCAFGLRRHKGSSALPGNSSITAARPLITAPKTKNQLRAVTPAGRVEWASACSLQPPARSNRHGQLARLTTISLQTFSRTARTELPGPTARAH